MAIDREDVGFLLAVASRRWNEALERQFAAAGFGDVHASYGSVLVPLFEEDGLRMGELARRSYLSKQTITTLVRLLERDGLVERRPDPDDARATRVFLTKRAAEFAPIADAALRRLARDVTRILGAGQAEQLRRSLLTLIPQLERNTRGSSPTPPVAAGPSRASSYRGTLATPRAGEPIESIQRSS
jgi:DNA-binding MarR family transcriptional regulator